MWVEVQTLSVVCAFPETGQSFGSEVVKKFTLCQEIR